MRLRAGKRRHDGILNRRERKTVSERESVRQFHLFVEYHGLHVCSERTTSMKYNLWKPLVRAPLVHRPSGGFLWVRDLVETWFHHN